MFSVKNKYISVAVIAASFLMADAMPTFADYFKPTFPALVKQDPTSSISTTTYACQESQVAFGIEIDGAGVPRARCTNMVDDNGGSYQRVSSVVFGGFFKSTKNVTASVVSSATVCPKDQVAVGISCDGRSTNCQTFQIICAGFASANSGSPVRWAYESAPGNCVWTEFNALNSDSTNNCPPNSFMTGLTAKPDGSRSILCCAGTTDTSAQFATQPETQCEMMENGQCLLRWQCFFNNLRPELNDASGGVLAGSVAVNAYQTVYDASYSCNANVAQCKITQGGCYAARYGVFDGGCTLQPGNFNRCSSQWSCLALNGTAIGEKTIFRGHLQGDGDYACHNWQPGCTNTTCTALRIY